MAKKLTAKAPKEKWIGCTVKVLPDELAEAAAVNAARVNPQNQFSLEGLPSDVRALVAPIQRIAVLNTKYWGTGGVHLTVGFMESTSPELKQKIVKYLNRWNSNPKYPVNVKFVETDTDPQVRISRDKGGYWSYLGTDVLSIPKNQQTMNLEGFTLKTPESEWERVVPHEAGHTLGFPHEHTRPEIVAMLDPNKTIALFGRTQGWSEEDVRQQILNPIRAGSFKGTDQADPTSIMCYGFPASITKNGKPIPGGPGINDSDYAFAAGIYPLANVPQPPAGDKGGWYVALFDENDKMLFRWPNK